MTGPTEPHRAGVQGGLVVGLLRVLTEAPPSRMALQQKPQGTECISLHVFG